MPCPSHIITPKIWAFVSSKQQVTQFLLALRSAAYARTGSVGPALQQINSKSAQRQGIKANAYFQQTSVRRVMMKTDRIKLIVRANVHLFWEKEVYAGASAERSSGKML